MLLARPDDDLRVADFFHLCGQQRAQFLARLRGNPARATVRDNALRVERGKIRARADVAGLQLHAQPERFNHAAAHLKFQRVVTEQPEMTGTAARRNARRDWDHAPSRGFLRERIEIRSRRCFGAASGNFARVWRCRLGRRGPRARLSFSVSASVQNKEHPGSF